MFLDQSDKLNSMIMMNRPRTAQVQRPGGQPGRQQARMLI